VPADTVRWQDASWKRSNRQAIVSHGASMHGLPALRQAPQMPWLDVAMIRMNHKGVSMDPRTTNTQGLGNVPEVVTHVQRVKKNNAGRHQA